MVKQADRQPKRFQFTVAKIKALAVPTGKPQVYFDAQVPHLAIRCHPTGVRTFVCIKRARGVTYRKTLGRFPELKIEVARMKARDRLNENAAWQAGGYKGVAPLGRPVDGDAITFGEAFELYIREVRKNSKRPDAAKHDLRGIYNLYLDHLPNTALESITAASMVRLHDKISARFKKGDELYGGKIAANRVIEKIRAVFNYAISKELFKGLNPARKGIVTKNPEKPRERYLQPEELARLEGALAKEANRDVCDFIKLLLETAVRKSNLYAMEWKEVSTTLCTWTIPENKTKNGSSLIVNLTPTALDILEARRRRRVNDNPWVFPTKVFSSKENNTGHTVDFGRQWTRLRKAAGVADCTMHDMRRTTASYMAIAGRSLQTIGAALGHKSTASTQIYARLHPDAVRDSLLAGQAKMEEMMKAAAKRAKAEQRKARRKLAIVPKTA